ncbi:hypothetical protein KPH14_005290 [Odynerus spinipes]|uniref:Uncharacterized protein n=1 Tax=Odynerus spinipes TaxID=1348599 RepID=A0AAD9RC43_9HYME|nr:hypothetical protein KPH14_005290 [Odynerus spinipes]
MNDNIAQPLGSSVRARARRVRWCPALWLDLSGSWIYASGLSQSAATISQLRGWEKRPSYSQPGLLLNGNERSDSLPAPLLYGIVRRFALRPDRYLN